MITNKDKQIKSEKYLIELAEIVGKALDEAEQGGIFCDINTYQALRNVRNYIQKYDLGRVLN